jgi:prepilin-type N-terminal cleavage/methylation domain-containing protein
MKKQNPLRNQEGFTLVEIIAVLIILGILAAVAVPRYIDLETSAKKRGLEAAVAELNGRESLVWADVKISDTSSTSWEVMQGTVAVTDPDSHLYLGADYSWDGDPKTGNATLVFKKTEATASRKPKGQHIIAALLVSTAAWSPSCPHDFLSYIAKYC